MREIARVGFHIGWGALLLASGSVASAQDVEFRGRVHGVRPPPGYYEVLARNPNAYQFQDVWKDVARRVRERRQQLVRARDFATLNSHFRSGRASRSAARASGTAVTGTFRFPVLIGYFADSTHSAQPDRSELDSLIFDMAAPPPYTVATFYDEMSSGLITVTGDVIGWFKADSASTYYEGSNNGLDPSTDATGDFIVELLEAADPTTDFSVYDNDSDGRVDLVAVLHPLVGGECGTSHIWSHRWVIAGWTGSAHTTDDGVDANDYMIQPAVGGSGGCSGSATMPIGTFSHELGHGMLDLPDLYDTSGSTNGIGVWGLMGAGNWNTQTSPAHLSAWSKDDVGWIAIDTITEMSGTGSRLLNPVITSDTAFRVDLSGESEYFLLENRHKIGTDVEAEGEGLLIWHVSPDLISSRRSSNTVNASMPHGLALEEADGDEDLDSKANRGDAGDPYPGSTGNTEFGPESTPNSKLNDGDNSGVLIDSITVNGDMSIAFQVNFNLVHELITTSIGTGTEVIVDGTTEAAPHSVFWVHPSDHTIGVDSIQGDTLTRYIFQSWSDGGAREHTVTADATPDTFTASLATEHRLKATADSGGTISSSVALDTTGAAWLAAGASATLTAEPDTANGFLFVTWSGDTTWTGDTLDLEMSRPYTVQAEFGPPVSVVTDTLPDALMGDSYSQDLEATGGNGEFTWSLVAGSQLPTGLEMDSTGLVSGVPEESGSFEFVVRAESGALSSSDDTVSLTITQPTLALQDVVDELLGVTDALDPAQERFLDLMGNDNGAFDIGDFRAYLQDNGLTANVAPAGLSSPVRNGAQAERGRDEETEPKKEDR